MHGATWLVCLLAVGAGTPDLQVQLARESESRGEVEVRGRLDAPVDRVWRVLTDQASYPRIFPEIRRMAVVRRGERGPVWRADVSLPWPLGDHWSEDEVEASRASRTVRWRHLAGSIRENSGSWRLREAPGGATEAIYSNRFDPGASVLPRWLIDWAISIGIPRVMDNLRRYVNSGA